MLLEAQNLSKSYGGEPVVRGVNFALHAGEILSLLGPNGAGKTTTVGMLYGAVLPNSGRVLFKGADSRSSGRECRRLSGVVTQENSLDPDFDVYENLLCFAHHYRLRGAAAAKRVAELLELTGLAAHRTKDIEQLSGGLKRRLMLARALIHEPEIVFLDEPTTGLDPEARQDFWKLVLELRAAGRGVLLTTHYMEEAERLSDRVLLMQHGSIVDEGSPAELVAKRVGREVAEIYGVPTATLEEFAQKTGTWCRPFSIGSIAGVPDGGRDAFREGLDRYAPERVVYRRANLEDVFLMLTGERIEE